MGGFGHYEAHVNKQTGREISGGRINSYTMHLHQTRLQNASLQVDGEPRSLRSVKAERIGETAQVESSRASLEQAKTSMLRASIERKDAELEHRAARLTQKQREEEIKNQEREYKAMKKREKGPGLLSKILSRKSRTAEGPFVFEGTDGEPGSVNPASLAGEQASYRSQAPRRKKSLTERIFGEGNLFTYLRNVGKVELGQSFHDVETQTPEEAWRLEEHRRRGAETAEMDRLERLAKDGVDITKLSHGVRPGEDRASDTGPGDDVQGSSKDESG
ncbi:MAG: hypothetical protein ABIF01_00215 [Candidatus Micrarchaeota archaeon]